MSEATIADTITAIAAIVGAVAAAIGVNTWRSEIKGRAEFDAARNLMRAVYRARQELIYVRSPFIAAQEFPEEYRASSPRSKTREEEASGYAHVFNQRWSHLAPAVEEIETAVLEAEVLFGKDVAAATSEFLRCIRRLRISMSDYVTEKASYLDPADREFSEQLRRDVFDTRSSENVLSKDFAKAIDQLERLLVKHLRGG